MALGLLLIVAALLLTVRNLLEESSADRAARLALQELEQALDSELTAYASDSQGVAVEWPRNADGSAMPWPTDESGAPLPTVTDAQGNVFCWPTDAQGTPLSWADGLWNIDADGNLLPWLTDDTGTFAWPTDEKGLSLSWESVREQIALRRQNFARYNQPDYVRNPYMEMPVEKINGNYYIGTLEIESIGLKLPIISEWNYSRLHVAPCRYTGSAYLGNMIIAGHNYKYHFGPLADLAIGDRVQFTDMDGNVFVYEVIELETLAKRDVAKMLAGDWDLTLFTCTYGGRSRVTVRCALLEE